MDEAVKRCKHPALPAKIPLAQSTNVIPGLLVLLALLLLRRFFAIARRQHAHIGIPIIRRRDSHVHTRTHSSKDEDKSRDYWNAS